MAECETSHYIRMHVADEPGVLGQAAALFGEAGVSIKSVLQIDTVGPDAEIVWLTHRGLEGKVNQALEQIRDVTAVKAVAPPIRVEV